LALCKDSGGHSALKATFRLGLFYPLLACLFYFRTHLFENKNKTAFL